MSQLHKNDPWSSLSKDYSFTAYCAYNTHFYLVRTRIPFFVRMPFYHVVSLDCALPCACPYPLIGVYPYLLTVFCTFDPNQYRTPSTGHSGINSVHWVMMIILYLLCFILKSHVALIFSQVSNQWFLGIFCHSGSKGSINHIQFNIQFLSTPTFEVTLSPLHKSENTKQWSNIRR